MIHKINANFFRSAGTWVNLRSPGCESKEYLVLGNV